MPSFFFFFPFQVSFRCLAIRGSSTSPEAAPATARSCSWAIRRRPREWRTTRTPGPFPTSVSRRFCFALCVCVCVYSAQGPRCLLLGNQRSVALRPRLIHPSSSAPLSRTPFMTHIFFDEYIVLQPTTFTLLFRVCKKKERLPIGQYVDGLLLLLLLCCLGRLG